MIGLGSSCNCPGPPFFLGGAGVFLLYSDTSGTPELTDLTSTVTSFVGVCIHENAWEDLEERFQTLKAQYSFEGLPFELHAKDFCLSFPEQDDIAGFGEMEYAARRSAVLAIRAEKVRLGSRQEQENRKKKYKSSEPFIHLTRAERSKLFEDALELIGSMDGVRLFGEVINKEYLSQIQVANYDPILQSVTQVVSRFDAFLSYYARTGPKIPNKGMLILDNEPTNENKIRGLINDFRMNGHPWGRVENVIEAPFFVDSKSVSAIQVADLCAYAVRRHVEHLDGEFEEQNFMRIFHRFDRGGGKLHGIRHYCPANTCYCKICITRGHFRSKRE